MRFEYLTTKVKDIKAHATRSMTGKLTVTQVDINGRPCEPSARFWTAFQANYGFSNNIFKYFSHDEVFDRISEVSPNDELRICVESSEDQETGNKRDRLLACSTSSKVLVKHDDMLGLLQKQGMNIDEIDYGGRRSHGGWSGRGGSIDPHGIRVGGVGGPLGATFDNLATAPTSGPAMSFGTAESWAGGSGAEGAPGMPRLSLPDISYHDGVIRSVHRLRNDHTFSIGGDEFSNRFVLDTPIDGYGKPSAYLMLLRQICANGSIGYSNTFKSEISLGKGEDKFDHALTRALEGFNNEDGFDALRQRFEMAMKSWCSIAEVNKAYKTLIRMHGRGLMRNVHRKYQSTEESADGTLIAEGSPIIRSFHKMVGDLHHTYGLANLDGLSVKRQATLPAGTKMYDMLNFLSETATHHTTPAGQYALQALVGDLVGAEYDLEGTVDKFGDWKDFLISDSSAAESYQMAQKL